MAAIKSNWDLWFFFASSLSSKIKKNIFWNPFPLIKWPTNKWKDYHLICGIADNILF